MPDTITSSAYLSVKFNLDRDGEKSSRTINLPEPKTNVVALNAARDQFVTDFNAITGHQYLIQPSSWRDTDDSEEAWQIDTEADIPIEFELKQSTSTKLGGS